MEQLGEVEALCRKLFESRDPNERAAADRVLQASLRSSSSQALQCFSTPEYFLHSRFLLENSNNPYVLLLASSSLTKVVSTHWTRFLPGQRTELRAIVQRRLLSLDAATMPAFALTGVVQLYARLVKLHFLDVQVQLIIAEILERFLGAPASRATGLQILIQLIADMNQAPPPAMTTTQNRKVAMQFRDGSLLQIFEMALVSLSQLSVGTASFGDDDRLCDLCLQLLNKCLSFDFLGTQPDERTEDTGTLQVPTSWRGSIEDQKTTDLLFKLYMSTANSPASQASTTPRSAQALECLIQLASVRRSLFSSDVERDKFFSRLISGISKILSTQVGLQNPANHHELCRLMMRFRSNFQLPQMIATEGYADFISLASQFTITSFRAFPYASRDASHYYLLHFWSRIAAANTYVRTGGPPSLLENFVPKVAEAYITSRLELAALVLQNPQVEDPLDNEEQLEEQLETLPQLGRCKFTDTSAFLLTAFDPLAQTFEKMVTAGNNGAQAQAVELQLTWLTYLIASILGGRLEAGASEEHDPVDGVLASRIFRLLILSDSRTALRPFSSHEKLERALLYFLQQFRRVFIGEQAMSSSKVYVRLAEDLGLGDHLHVLNFMINKIGTNLKRWGREPRIIEKTLCLFQDLASGYSSGKLLSQLEGINQLLTHHTSEYFPFLDQDENLRSRTTYYNTLAKLFLTMDDNAVRFRAFMEPFRAVFLAIGAQLHDPAIVRQPIAQRRLIGLLRDLRGIADACVSRRSHTLFFDWLYPNFSTILTQVAQVYSEFPAITTPLLKLYAELVHNKQCRLNFDCSSANGILLFRETSKVICAYGAPTLQRAVGADPYAEKYKGIWLCMLALTRTFTGNYVCFGVFSLYKDPSLTDALGVVLKLATSIPLADGVLHYPKVTKAFFNLIEALTEHHMTMLGEVDTPTFSHIAVALKEALRHVDSGISSLGCLALDNMATYHYRSVKDGAAGLTAHFTAQPELLPTLLLSMMNVMLFDESSNQYCLSRPIFSFICIAPGAWTAVQEELYSRNAEHRGELAAALELLMQDVQPVLDARNRDKFSNNLSTFRQNVKHWIV